VPAGVCFNFSMLNARVDWEQVSDGLLLSQTTSRLVMIAYGGPALVFPKAYRNSGHLLGYGANDRPQADAVSGLVLCEAVTAVRLLNRRRAWCPFLAIVGAADSVIDTPPGRDMKCANTCVLH